MKKILSLDLDITSIGYSVLNQLDNNKFSIIDYGVHMFDSPYDKDGNSKKTIHNQNTSISKLYDLRKKRKKNLAKLFEDFNLGKKDDFLNQEKNNLFTNKWYLRAKKAFEEKLTIEEFFSVLYLIAKHRGYKSLDSDDLLEEFCEKLGLNQEVKKVKKDDEKGRIKQALNNMENFKLQFPKKTIAQIIYEIEIQKNNPTFRNHDNYNYMIKREYINEEIKILVLSQNKFQLFNKDFNIKSFIDKLIEIIDDQKEVSNNLFSFGNCKYIKNEKVAHQYSLLADIYKIHEATTSITFNSNKLRISKKQIKIILDYFFDKLTNCENITDIKYKDIRKILKLSDDIKIFNKEDSYKSKNKIYQHTIVNFNFVNNLSKYDKSFISNILNKPNKYYILKDIFDILRDEIQPKLIYEKLSKIFLEYDLIKDESIKNNIILELIKNKNGNGLDISHQAMINIIPYFEEGLLISQIKEKLNLKMERDYLSFKKGIKYLNIKQFEEDNKLIIDNHVVKYIVSIALRVTKHLHLIYGSFDEIKFKSTNELNLYKNSEDIITQILKRYYPCSQVSKNHIDVIRIHERIILDIKKVLKLNVKNTNIHHAIEAILIGITNQSLIQLLSNIFRKNTDIIDEIIKENIEKLIPIFIDEKTGEIKELNKLIELIEDNYTIYKEDSIFYKDLFGKTKAINFWVSGKPMVSKIHKDTIYAKKPNSFYTTKESIINHFVELKISYNTNVDKFYEDFRKTILEKLYVYKINPNDIICKIVQNRAKEIMQLLASFQKININDKDAIIRAKQNLDELIHKPLLDNNQNVIRKVKFYQTNLSGFNIRGGLAIKEKTFIGFKVKLNNDKLLYERIDVINKYEIKQNNFLIIRNNLICVNFKNKNLLGFIESFDENTNKIRMFDSRYSKRLENQPEKFKVTSGKSRKEFAIAGAIGIIKINLDILGNINSLQTIGNVQSELYNFLKEMKFN